MSGRKGRDPKRTPAERLAARKAVKKALAEHATKAFSAVFNDLFPMAAEAAPHGSIHNFARWHLQAMRKELEERERGLL